MAERRPPAITLDAVPDEKELQNEAEALAVVQAFAAKAGVDIATITGTANIPISGVLQWGTATGVYTNVTPLTFSTYEWQADNTLQYRLTFTLTGVQLNANQAYFAKIFFNDGTSSSELTWTQPGLAANANDQVFFYDRVQVDFAAVSDIAARAAAQGWLSPSDWADFGRLMYSTAWYNYVRWNDGR